MSRMTARIDMAKERNNLEEMVKKNIRDDDIRRKYLRKKWIEIVAGKHLDDSSEGAGAVELYPKAKDKGVWFTHFNIDVTCQSWVRTIYLEYC